MDKYATGRLGWAIFIIRQGTTTSQNMRAGIFLDRVEAIMNAEHLTAFLPHFFTVEVVPMEERTLSGGPPDYVFWMESDGLHGKTSFRGIMEEVTE